VIAAFASRAMGVVVVVVVVVVIDVDDPITTTSRDTAMANLTHLQTFGSLKQARG
jgi:hypothetical protein